MIGISMVSSRRLPASLSSRPMMMHRQEFRTPGIAVLLLGSGNFSIMTWHRLDGRDDFVIADFLAGADERGIVAVHQDGQVVLGVAAQGVDEFLPLIGSHGSKVHEIFSFGVD